MALRKTSSPTKPAAECSVNVRGSRAAPPEGVPSIGSSLSRRSRPRGPRDGLTRALIDLRLGQARPARGLINEFFATVSPALLETGARTVAA
jgi:hypothetical protein